jgi:lysozyme
MAQVMTTELSRELSVDGLAFIKHWEGYRGRLYHCPSGKLTIGYGHLVTPNQLSAYRDGIDMVTGERLLRQDIKYFVDIVNYTTRGIKLKQQQFDVLVSFAFNVGSTAFLNSTLLKDLQQGKFDRISKEMRRWVHDDNGKIIEGLLKRRTMEAKIFDGLMIEIALGLRRR